VFRLFQELGGIVLVVVVFLSAVAKRASSAPRVTGTVCRAAEDAQDAAHGDVSQMSITAAGAAHRDAALHRLCQLTWVPEVASRLVDVLKDAPL
jgi:hypothetical protein